MLTRSANGRQRIGAGTWLLRLLSGCLAACLIGYLSGCSPATPPVVLAKPLAQHLYIWQRLWRPAHTAALRQSHADFQQLRVLALQYHASSSGPIWTPARPDWQLLASDQRPVSLVVRLDGQLRQIPSPTLLWQQLHPLLHQAQQAGVLLQAIEIDYDAARAALGTYRSWLQQLRPLLPSSLALQITALPDWLRSAEYPRLCQAVSTLTLQLHSVLSPAQGLFDAHQAKAWTLQAAHIPCPLFLALPAYHSALIETADGPRIESEMPLSHRGPRQELLTRPEAVADFLRWLRTESLPALRGLVWFRLPLADDQRSWPLITLQAVVRGEPLYSRLDYLLQAQDGRFEVQAHNPGNLSTRLPDKLAFHGIQCLGGAAIPGYHWQSTATRWWLQRTAATQPMPLAPGQRQSMGWLRCRALQQITETP